jgi:glycosyltransferase involved in cell wall biosynthesis
MAGDSLSVVICAYTTDRWTRLQASVRSVVEQIRPSDEILVVVDHSQQLRVLADEVLAPMGVRVLDNSDLQGLSGARNTGVALATGDVVVFLDDDAVALPGWIEGHAAHYADPIVVGVGGAVVADWENAAPLWFPPEFGWVVGCSFTGQPTTTAEIRNPIGANMSFRRSVLDAVGGFSHSLGRVGTAPRGCEETEFSIRTARAFPGSRILHEPGAAVHHHVPDARARWSYFRRRCWSEGQSKADVSRLSDPRQALSAERIYVSKALPAAVRRDVAHAARQRQPQHLLRAAALCAGLAVTTAGYVVGRLRPPGQSW